MHEHENLFISSVHVAPFWQGLLAHSSIFAEKRKKKFLTEPIFNKIQYKREWSLSWLFCFLSYSRTRFLQIHPRIHTWTCWCGQCMLLQKDTGCSRIRLCQLKNNIFTYSNKYCIIEIHRINHLLFTFTMCSNDAINTITWILVDVIDTCSCVLTGSACTLVNVGFERKQENVKIKYF